MKSFSSKRRIAALSICVLSSIASVGYAAESEDMAVYEGEEYVVTATKTPLEEKKVPMAVEVINREQLDNMGAYSLQDALRFSMGVNVLDDGHSGLIGMRGMTNEHTLVLIDGKRMASEIDSSHINVYELNRVNMADVERIEIIRGSGSALYGSDALGGIINIITKKAAKEGGSLHMYTGSKRAGTEFTYSTGKVGKLSAKISGGLEKIRTINYPASIGSVTMGKMGTFNYTTEDTNRYGIRRYLGFDLGYDLGHNRSLDFEANFMREQLSRKSVTGPYISASGGWALTSASNSIDADDNNRSEYALTFSGKDDRNDYLLRTYYGNFKTSSSSYETGVFNGWGYNQYETFAVEGKDSWTIDKHNRMTFGAEYRYTSMNGTTLEEGGDNVRTLIKNGIEESSSEKSTELFSAFVQDEWQVNDKLLVIPAVRYDNYDSFGGQASPKVGITYSFSDNSRFKVNYGKAFRAPSIYEMYASMDHGGMFWIYGNPDLKPEEAKTFDVSFEGEKGKFNAKATYFYTKADNLITTAKLEIQPGHSYADRKYTNVDKATLQGTELEMGYRFDKHWGIKATHSYLDARDDIANERLEYRARQTGTVQLAYTNAKTNPLTATLWNQYHVDYKHASGEYYTFATTHFVVDKKIGKNINIYAGVDNIFDKELASYDIIDGRFWRVGAQLTF